MHKLLVLALGVPGAVITWCAWYRRLSFIFNDTFIVQGKRASLPGRAPGAKAEGKPALGASVYACGALYAPGEQPERSGGMLARRRGEGWVEWGNWGPHPPPRSPHTLYYLTFSVTLSGAWAGQVLCRQFRDSSLDFLAGKSLRKPKRFSHGIYSDWADASAIRRSRKSEMGGGGRDGYKKHDSPSPG